MCCPVSRSFTLKSTDVKSIEEVRYAPLETAQIVGVNAGSERIRGTSEAHRWAELDCRQSRRRLLPALWRQRQAI